MVLLIMTLFISTVTLATGRTTILQGAVHLVIFGDIFVSVGDAVESRPPRPAHQPLAQAHWKL